MNGIGYKIKKTILYILLILLSVVCMFPFLLMIVNATRSGSEIVKSFTLIPSVYSSAGPARTLRRPSVQ